MIIMLGCEPLREYLVKSSLNRLQCSIGLVTLNVIHLQR